VTSLGTDLTGIVGGAHVLDSPDLLDSYTTDWTRRYHGPASCVVRPGSTAEVAEVVRCCRRHGAAVIPQGGNTGLVGGSVPPPASARDRVLLSLRRLGTLDPVDTLAGQVTAGAGVTLASLRDHAAAAGLSYGVDLAARDSATVGGTIATNAGGMHTLRYGLTRAQVSGVEAVLADGFVMSHMSGLTSDNSGYDLAGLLAGSEGTLAVITAARLRLWPAEPVAAVLLAGVPGIEDAAAMYARLRSHVSLRACEYFEAAGLGLVRQAAGLPPPLARAYPGYVLAEIAGTDEEEAAQRLAVAGVPDDAALALDNSSRAALWAYRERHTEAISAAGIPHKLDVGVPLSRIGEFRARLDEAVRAAAGPDVRLIVFGHLGVGNLHINVLGPEPGDERVDEAVLRLAAGCGGTISAEHGIGRAKARWLHLSRSAAEVTAMRAVKAALDPDGMLNPGVIFVTQP
jgi:FAD/FMN-containing dehydrogenase